MALTRYGAQYVGDLDGGNEAGLRYFIVTSGHTITKGDFVKLASGYVDIAAAGDRLIGVANETVVGDGTKKLGVIVDDDAVYYVQGDNVGTSLAQAHVGTNFDITGTTGAQGVDTSTTSTGGGQLMCIAFNPKGDDTAAGYFVIVESQLVNAASQA